MSGTAEMGSGNRPLIVDLDGTLIKTDLLIESFFALLATRPFVALRCLFALFAGRAAFKASLAAAFDLDARLLPLNDALIEHLRAEKQAGRPIYLASASDRVYVAKLAARVGLFDGIFGSDAGQNLRGPAKAALLCEKFGEAGFDYAGNDWVDLAVWRKAHRVIAVNASPSLIERVQRDFPDAVIIAPKPSQARFLLRAMRPHQWLKNLLVLVPALAAHHFTWSSLSQCALAFLSFSLCASSVYLLNDLLDLPHDRVHPSKSRRPFAAGDADLAPAIPLLTGALAGAVLVGLALPGKFLLTLSVYYALTLGYSTFLKRQPSLDVIALACLYGLRLVAGSAATMTPLSPWLVIFSIFLFLCLALVKRWTELVARQLAGSGDPSGRAYRLGDLPVIQTMATASGYISIMLLGLYLNSPVVTMLYRHPARLWGLTLILLYWLNRVLLLTHRGDMEDDPVLFAVKDRVSLSCVVLAGLDVALSI